MKLKAAILMTIFSFSTLAGRETGNGGFAHVCRNKKGKITSAKLLDLWEGEELKTWASQRPADEQIKNILKKIGDVSLNALSLVQANYENIRNNYIFTGRPLSKSEDAFPPYEPGNGCSYEQVARFESVLTETGQGGLRINREIYDSAFFTESDRAALMIHEAIYMADRAANDATTSTRTRVLVAHLFSESTMPNAVRMTFAKLIYGEFSWIEGVNKKKPIFAVKDRTKFVFSFHVGRLDGVQSYSGEASDEHKKNLYRCTVERIGDVLADSGWVTIDEILDLNKPNVGTAEVPYSRLVGTYPVGEFLPPSGSTAAEGMEFGCYKRGNDGVEVPVTFAGFYHPEDGGECLNMNNDGSTSVSSGDACLVWLESIEEAELKDIAPFEIVKSQPVK